MSTYLDHAATTPLRECALEAWTRTQRDLATTPGSPTALHFGGRRTHRMLDDAREQVATALSTDIHEAIFTSGVTEPDALDVIAAAWGMHGRDDTRDLTTVSDFEYGAIVYRREVAPHEDLSWGVLPMGTDGASTLPHVSGDDVPASWNSRFASGSMTLASSEIGTTWLVADFAEFVQVSGDLAYCDVA